MISNIIALAIAATACSIACYSDLTARRVPNALTLPLLGIAPLLAAFNGVHAALSAAAIVVVSLFVGVAVHSAGILGGGDVKLLAGIGALAGFPACVDVALYTALFGGLLAVGVSAARGELTGILARVRVGITSSVAGRSLALGAVAIDAGGARIPYALAIGAGFAVATLAQTVLPFLRIIR